MTTGMKRTGEKKEKERNLQNKVTQGGNGGSRRVSKGIVVLRNGPAFREAEKTHKGTKKN